MPCACSKAASSTAQSISSCRLVFILFFCNDNLSQTLDLHEFTPVSAGENIPVKGFIIAPDFAASSIENDLMGNSFYEYLYQIPLIDFKSNQRTKLDISFLAGRKGDTVILFQGGISNERNPKEVGRIGYNTKFYEQDIIHPTLEKFGHRLRWVYMAQADTIDALWKPNLKLDHAIKASIQLGDCKGWLIREIRPSRSGFLNGQSVFRLIAKEKKEQFTHLCPLDKYNSGDTLVVGRQMFSLHLSGGYIKLKNLSLEGPLPSGVNLGYKLPVPDTILSIQGDTIQFDSFPLRLIHFWCFGCKDSFRPISEINALASALNERHNTHWLHIVEHHDSLGFRQYLLDNPIEGDCWYINRPLNSVGWPNNFPIRLFPTWLWIDRSRKIVWKGQGTSGFEALKEFVNGKSIFSHLDTLRIH